MKLFIMSLALFTLTSCTHYKPLYQMGDKIKIGKCTGYIKGVYASLKDYTLVLVKCPTYTADSLIVGEDEITGLAEE
jgi:hypothetical protein